MTTRSGSTVPSQASRRALGRALEVALSLYGAAIFTLLWVGFAIGLATDGRVLTDAWAWLTGLEPVAAVVAWILLLPIAVGLLAWDADLAPLAGAAVLVALVVWTLAAASGLVRTFRRR
jgi:hypothetical protein